MTNRFFIVKLEPNIRRGLEDFETIVEFFDNVKDEIIRRSIMTKHELSPTQIFDICKDILNTLDYTDDTKSDIKILSIIPNINRGLDYWETIITFYDADTKETYSRSYTTNNKLESDDLAKFIDDKKDEIVNEIKQRKIYESEHKENFLQLENV